ncbi:MAG: hypothetical protein A2Z03_04140 [Chloroflexi bacterium RBG_16_56_8]|nr:MAG: hypothetical protein A2Z03_04140 [Chloroflexi bacterium RBG_16_56_8]
MLTDLNGLLTLFLALTGFAALAAVVVDVLKRLNVIGDGQAPLASLIINLVGFVLFVLANILGLDVAGLDKVLGSVASLLVTLLGLLWPLIASRGFHAGLRGVPLLSYSHKR